MSDERQLRSLEIRLRSGTDQLMAFFRDTIRRDIGHPFDIDEDALTALHEVYIPQQEVGYVPEDDKDDPDAVDYWLNRRFPEWEEQLERAYPTIERLMQWAAADGPGDVADEIHEWLASDLDLSKSKHAALFWFRSHVNF